MASVGAIALTAGFMMLALAGPANADQGGIPNANSNGNASSNSQGNNGNGNGNGNAFGHDNGSVQGNENAHGNNPNANGNANNDGNGKKVDVCHATGSMTNPYVFINVSVNSLKNGHGMHQDDPNKTWKEAAYWHGNHAAGSARPDLTGVSEEYCETAPTAIQPPAVVTPDVDKPDAAKPDAVKPEGEVKGIDKTRKPPVKKPAVKGTEAVPTAVAAGIGGSGPTSGSPFDLLAQMLVGGGLALLLSAGWMQIGRKANWVNQA